MCARIGISIRLGFCIAMLVMASSAAIAQRTESTVNESYKAALGREANSGEKNYWMGRRDWQTQDDLVKFHMVGLRGDGGLRQQVIDAAMGKLNLNASQAVKDWWLNDLAKTPRKFEVVTKDIRAWFDARQRHIIESYKEALGRDPSGAEVAYWQTRTDYNGTAGLVALHVQGIKTNQALADEMIVNSYLNAFRYRPQAGGGEVTHWRQHARLGWTHKMILAEHEKWKQSVPPAIKGNQKLITTMQKQHIFLDTNNNLVKVSPQQAAQIVAGGGGNIVAGGGGNVIAPAGTFLISKGGAGIVSQNGTKLIGDGGGT